MNTEYFDFKNNKDSTILKQLGNSLKNGSIGIFPTDTVYGIGCNVFDENAIQKLFEFKSRDYNKPINVLISNLEMLPMLIENISEEEQKLIDSFWPGPLTIIFKKRTTISNLLTSNLDTIGVRMPNNKIALDLIDTSNTPLATTSVNFSGKKAGTKVEDFFSDFNDKVDFMIDTGSSPIGKASTIIQMINSIPHILREGTITEEQIKKVLVK